MDKYFSSQAPNLKLSHLIKVTFINHFKLILIFSSYLLLVARMSHVDIMVLFQDLMIALLTYVTNHYVFVEDFDLIV